MRFERLSITRKALMWWFQWPSSPYVSLNGVVDFTAAQSYLDRLNNGSGNGAGDGGRVTVHHLVVAIAARTIKAFPAANARIIGHRLQRLDDVGVAMPVNLVGHAAKTKIETGMTLVERASEISLRDVSDACRTRVGAEREGKTANPIIRGLYRAVDLTPYRVLARVLDALSGTLSHPAMARHLYLNLPVSTAVTNVGSNVTQMDGALFRGGAMTVPIKLLHIGSFWGVAPVQDEVIPVDGVPAVRPMLPIILVFDHRLFDGVAAGNIFAYFANIVRDPAAVFGEDGMACPEEK